MTMNWHPYPKEKPTGTFGYGYYLVSMSHEYDGQSVLSAIYYLGRDEWVLGLQEDCECINVTGIVTAWAELPKPYQKSCTNCEYLRVINKNPVYARCSLTDYTFLLWKENTDNHCCEHHEEVNHDVTVECMVKDVEGM